MCFIPFIDYGSSGEPNYQKPGWFGWLLFLIATGLVVFVFVITCL